MSEHVLFYGASTEPQVIPEIPKQNYEFMKIPFGIIEEALNFFRVVWLERNTEACVFITYNPETGQFGLEMMDQYVTPGNVEWENDGSIPGVVGSIHSHHTMRGNFSHTDLDDNRKNFGLHLVIGDIEATPSLDAEISINSRHVLKLNEHFELADIIEDWEQFKYLLECPSFMSDRERYKKLVIGPKRPKTGKFASTTPVISYGSQGSYDDDDYEEWWNKSTDQGRSY